MAQKNNKNVHVFDLAAIKKQQQLPSNKDSVFVKKARGLSVPATSTPDARAPSKPVRSRGIEEQAVLRGQTVRRVKPTQVRTQKPRYPSRLPNEKKSRTSGEFKRLVGVLVASFLIIIAVFSVYLLTQTSELRGREQRVERLAGLDGSAGPSSREGENSRETVPRVSDVVTSNDAGKEANETSENKPQESKTEASPDPHELSGMNEGTPISVTPAVDPAAKKNRQKENRKHARDVLKSADKLLSLPRWNNYDPHPLGLPWDEKFNKLRLGVELIPLLQFNIQRSFTCKSGDGNVLYEISKVDSILGELAEMHVADILVDNNQLCWSWKEGTQEPTALAVLFSSMKIGGEEFYFLEKPEPFTHEISIEELIDFGDKDTEIIFSDEQLAQCTAPNNEHDSLESQQLNWKDLKAAGLTPMFFIECSATGFDKKLELLYDLKNLKTNQDIPVLQFVKDIDWTKEPNVKIRIEIRLQRIESDKGVSLKAFLTPKWFVGGNWIPLFQGFSAKEFVKNSRKDIDLRLEDIFQWRGQDVEELAVDLDNLKNKDAKGIVEASLELQEKTGVVWLNNFVRDQVPLKKAKLQQLQKAMESYKKVHSWENDNKTAGKIKRSEFLNKYADRTDELFEAFELVFNAFNSHTVKLRDKSRDSNNQELEKWKNLKEKIERLKDEQLEVRVFCKVIGTMGKEVKLFWDD
ncbi:MAG: hypothetical protein ACR2NF_11295 [Pirellulales bacterium]